MRPNITTTLSARTAISTDLSRARKFFNYLMTQSLDFLMTEDDNYLVLEDITSDAPLTRRTPIITNLVLEDSTSDVQLTRRTPITTNLA